MQRRPSRIETGLMAMAGVVVEIGATFHAQPRAVLPAQGLERQIEHHLITQQRLEVDEVARQSAREGIVRLHPWVDEQLLDADLQLIGDLTKAPYALPAHLDHGAATD